MAAASLDLYLEQGATFRRVLTFKDKNGVLQDLTGYVFTGQIRKTANDATLLASMVCTVLNQVTNKGEVEILISAGNTSLIPVAKSKTAIKEPIDYAYDIERLAPDTITKVRIIEGIMKVSPEVTK